jgi:hypothetical protein
MRSAIRVAGLFHADAQPHQAVTVGRGAAGAVQVIGRGQAGRPRPAIADLKEIERIDEGAHLRAAELRAKDKGKQSARPGEITRPEFMAGAAIERRMQHGLHLRLRG